MPYFRERVVEGVETLATVGTSIVPGYFVTEASNQMTFRTKARRPKGLARIDLVADSVAEPFSYFEKLEELKRFGLKASSPGMLSGVQPDTGHSWDLLKYSYEGDRINWSTSDGSRSYVYQGPPLPAINGQSSWWLTPTLHNLTSEGAKLFGRAAPSPDMFNLAQFLGELREGLPRLTSQLLKGGNFFRGLGGDYLNVQFGWKPFLNDLQNLGKAAMAAQSAISGEPQVIRRTRKGISDSGASYPDLGAGPPGFYQDVVPPGFDDLFARALDPYHRGWLPTYYYRSVVPSTEFVETEYSVWFSGQFYVLPKLNYNPDSYLERLGALMNTDITPSVLWELAPWSWLTDWFLNIGSTLTSYEAAVNNRVLAQYAYVMEQSSIKRTVYTSSALANYGFLTNPRFPGGRSVFTTVSKRRARANPFGFQDGITTSLNGGQLAILGALGLTKL